MNNFETLYYFMNENVSLVEIKRTDIQSDDKSKIYSWVFIKNDDLSLETLVFNEMSVEDVNGNKINVRKFTNAEFRFDDNFGKFQHVNGGHIIMKVPSENLPSQLREIISKSLS